MANVARLNKFTGQLQTFRSKTMSYINEMTALAAEIGGIKENDILAMGGNADLVDVFNQCKAVYVKIKAIIDAEKNNLPDDTEIS